MATDDGSVGHHGLVTDLLDDELDLDAHAEVYACGPPAMLEAVRVLCAVRDIPAQLALESGMACGFGACFGCVVPTKHGYIRLCVDGPVRRRPLARHRRVRRERALSVRWTPSCCGNVPAVRTLGPGACEAVRVLDCAITAGAMPQLPTLRSRSALSATAACQRHALARHAEAHRVDSGATHPAPIAFWCRRADGA